MKAKLKSPLFWMSPNDPMIYVFWKENKVTDYGWLKKCHGWKGDAIVDSTGTKYVIRRAVRPSP